MQKGPELGLRAARDKEFVPLGSVNLFTNVHIFLD